jgi:hypothetical protein
MSGSARGTRRQVPNGPLDTGEPERPADTKGATRAFACSSHGVESGSIVGGASAAGISPTGREPGARRTARQRRKPFVL